MVPDQPPGERPEQRVKRAEACKVLRLLWKRAGSAMVQGFTGLSLTKDATPEARALCNTLGNLQLLAKRDGSDSLEKRCSGFLTPSERYTNTKKHKFVNVRYLIGRLLQHEGYPSAVPPEWLEDRREHHRLYFKELRQEEQLAAVVAVPQPPIGSSGTDAAKLPEQAGPTATDVVPSAATDLVPPALEVTAETLDYNNLHGRWVLKAHHNASN